MVNILYEKAPTRPGMEKIQSAKKAEQITLKPDTYFYTIWARLPYFPF